MHFHYFLLVPVFVLAAQLLYRLGRALFSPLRDVPGPFLARFTRLWYFHRVRQGHFEHDNIRLHEKYGPVVRIAPNQYSISDPSAVKTVYALASHFGKSAWYDAWRHPQGWNLFTDRDMKRHSDTRKRLSSLYSMSSLVHYESLVDSCADIFLSRLDEFARNGQSLNLAHWLQCYAFDVIGNLTFGERFGFLDRGEDIEGAMDAVHASLFYSTLVGILPEWHPHLFALLGWLKAAGPGARVFLANFVQEKIRQHEEKRPEADPSNDNSIRTQDFVEKMMIARDKDPLKITDYHLFITAQSNVLAGSDTTSISLSSIMWNLMQHPEVLRKLRQEMDEFKAEGKCSSIITFKESQSMPYMQTVIKEALRMHSATGLPLWRDVPAGGTSLNGKFFPEGSVVGINSWVAHYDERVFPDAKIFRPERWIEAESNPEQLREMNQMYMPFGLGSRTCLGRHISILEMSKLIPRLVERYDFTQETWATKNFWFVMPVDFQVSVKIREDSASK